MKYLLLSAAALLMLSVDVQAQQGCQAGCTTATRARQNPEPTPTPDTLRDVSAETVTAVGFSPPTSFASSRRVVEARPVGNVNVLGLQVGGGRNRDRGDEEGLGTVSEAQVLADVAEYKARVAAVESRVTDLIARGDQIPTRAEIAAEIADVDVYDMVVRDPRFKVFINKMVQSQGLVLEIEPVE